MAMTAGSVTVDDDGNETFVPNDATNLAMAFYVMLLSVNASGKKETKVGGGKATLNPDGTVTPPPPVTTQTVTFTIDPTPTIKQKMADMANGFASVIVPYLQAHAQAKIPATAAGNGLMNDSTNAPCKHPATDQFITIV